VITFLALSLIQEINKSSALIQNNKQPSREILKMASGCGNALERLTVLASIFGAPGEAVNASANDRVGVLDAFSKILVSSGKFKSCAVALQLTHHVVTFTIATDIDNDEAIIRIFCGLWRHLQALAEVRVKYTTLQRSKEVRLAQIHHDHVIAVFAGVYQHCREIFKETLGKHLYQMTEFLRTCQRHQIWHKDQSSAPQSLIQHIEKLCSGLTDVYIHLSSGKCDFKRIGQDMVNVVRNAKSLLSHRHLEDWINQAGVYNRMFLSPSVFLAQVHYSNVPMQGRYSGSDPESTLSPASCYMGNARLF
jgi:hypothetical protein